MVSHDIPRRAELGTDGCKGSAIVTTQEAHHIPWGDQGSMWQGGAWGQGGNWRQGGSTSRTEVVPRGGKPGRVQAGGEAGLEARQEGLSQQHRVAQDSGEGQAWARVRAKVSIK